MSSLVCIQPAIWFACESRRSGANASPGAWVMTTFSDSRRRFDNILFMTITKQRLFLFPLNGKHSACIIHSRSWSRVLAETPRLHIALWNFYHLRRRDGEAFKFFSVCLNYIIVAWQQRGKKQSGFTAAQDVWKLMWHFPVVETRPCRNRFSNNRNGHNECVYMYNKTLLEV